MALSTQVLQDELDALELAIASGVTTVTHNGKTATYDNLAGLQARARWLRGRIGGAGARRTRFRQFRFPNDRGRQ